MENSRVTTTYAHREGSFGRAVVLELREPLVAHAHSETQFAFWLGGGRVEARLGGAAVQYSEDIALGTNAYESHDARMLEKSIPAVFLILYIAKDWLDELRASSGRPFFFPSPRVPINAALRQACWRLLDMMVSPEPTPGRLEREVEAIISAGIDATLASVDPAAMRRRTPMLDYRLRTAIVYMREHVAEPIAIEDVAGKVGLSRAHYFSLFRDQLNTTPQVFWSAVRVEEAVRRLVLRDEPLTSVAIELGFSSPGNFSRFFKEHMGVSPSAFRRGALVRQRHPVTGLE